MAGAAGASAKYGVGWVQTTHDQVGGAGVVIGSYAMRCASPAYIRGLLKTPVAPPSVPNPPGANDIIAGAVSLKS